MVKTVKVTGTILIGDDLTARSGEIEEQRPPSPPPELQNKYRWIQCTMKNETQFDLHFLDTYFDAGRYWAAPVGTTPPFTQTTWSACNNDLSIATGAVGGSTFRLDLNGVHMGFALGWAAPAMGSYKAGVAESEPAVDAYDAARTEGGSLTSRHVFEGCDKDGNRAQFRIHVDTTSGRETLVAIKQISVA
ncbi:hypothetical protein LXA43DRAFT_1102884 [Ganoderma leucocontextum]|nr:hypothetical protein LXA43DRAFT_1102884 [Ganoderma leucocontextum]